MNVLIDAQNRVFLNGRCMGKMDFLPFTKSEIERDGIKCFVQIMKWIVRTHLQEPTSEYLFKRIGNRSTPELSSFWINGKKIFDDLKMSDLLTTFVQLLSTALEFVKEYEKKSDTLWLILKNIDRLDICVERKINILNPGLKNFVLERQQGTGLLSADFHDVVLPCFKAVIRDLMGVGK